MILLDFYSGSHGFFLEYVINTFIFQGPKVENIFTDMSTAHGIHKDKNYQKFKKISAMHYSEFQFSINEKFDKVVRISVDNFKEISCYQINVNNRAGDIPADKKNNSIPQEIRNSRSLLRNDFYSKLLDKSLGYPLPEKWRDSGSAVYNFKMASMYDLFQFYTQLRELSIFLERSFKPDLDLVDTWKKFINVNHGLNAWKKTNNLLKNILFGIDSIIDLNVEEEALLNALLTKCIGIADGPMFDLDEYPTRTLNITSYVQSFVNDFDIRFINFR